jgi:NAD(P)-dependent dehydrogenase (short-subunit alcohol dehydrogenase family)
MELESFGSGLNVAVFGASGGLGRAFSECLSQCPDVSRIFAFSRRNAAIDLPKTEWQNFDLTDEASIAEVAETVEGQEMRLHLVILATGILHQGKKIAPEKSWRTLDAEAMNRVFQLNTVGPALIAKHFMPLLARDRKAAFAAISARVGSIEDNALGGWHSYRASKAALNMLIKNFAIELARKHPLGFCVGLHPGTVDTGLSKPFQRGVPENKLFSPKQSVAYLLSVLDRLKEGDSGKVFAWDGHVVPA